MDFLVTGRGKQRMAATAIEFCCLVQTRFCIHVEPSTPESLHDCLIGTCCSTSDVTTINQLSFEYKVAVAVKGQPGIVVFELIVY
jgi:hypothetical protein